MPFKKYAKSLDAWPSQTYTRTIMNSNSEQKIGCEKMKKLVAWPSQVYGTAVHENKVNVERKKEK